MMPESSVIKFASLRKEYLFNIGSNLKGKALIGYDVASLTSPLREVFMIMVTGLLTDNNVDTKKCQKQLLQRGQSPAS